MYLKRKKNVLMTLLKCKLKFESVSKTTSKFVTLDLMRLLRQLNNECSFSLAALGPVKIISVSSSFSFKCFYSSIH